MIGPISGRKRPAPDHCLLDVNGRTDTDSYLVSVFNKSCGCRVAEMRDGSQALAPCPRHCEDCCIPLESGKLNGGSL